MNCKSCDNGLEPYEEQFEQCLDCRVEENIILDADVFEIKKAHYKTMLFAQLEGCDFNGQGMQQLLSEFSDEVNGS